MDKTRIQRAVTLSVCSNMARQGMYYVPGAASARHVHLSRKDIDVLFGMGYKLTELKPLSQPGQFACNEKVTVIGPKGQIEGFRVLGPERKESQVEVSLTDSFKLGVKPVVRMSGEPAGSSGGIIVGPKGRVELSEGIMIAARHLHISLKEAEIFKLKNGDIISLKKSGEREITFGNVVVRSGEGHSLELHLDTDEANAAMLKNGELLEVIR